MTILNDITHELDMRNRGRDDRLARLRAAGLPTDRAGLERVRFEMLADEHDATNTGLYAASTSCTGTAGLKREELWACGVDFVAVTFTEIKAADLDEADPDAEDYTQARVDWAGVGICRSFPVGTPREEMIASVREHLLRRYPELHTSRQSAIAAAEAELAARAADFRKAHRNKQ